MHCEGFDIIIDIGYRYPISIICMKFSQVVFVFRSPARWRGERTYFWRAGTVFCLILLIGKKSEPKIASKIFLAGENFAFREPRHLAKA